MYNKKIKELYSNYALVRKRAKAIRTRTINELEDYLKFFEQRFTENLGRIEWAESKDVLYSKIDTFVKKNSFERYAYDPKSCYVSEIAEKYEKHPYYKFSTDTPTDKDTPVVVEADYLLADTGSIVFLDNKALSKIKKLKQVVVVATIDKVVSSMKELLCLSELYAINRYGRKQISNLLLLNNAEGVEITLFLLDDKESILLSQPEQRAALYCIHCGNCSQVCPIKNGHTPIDKIKQPFVSEKEEDIIDSKRTTLCRECDKYCPMNIPISDLLIQNRNYFSEEMPEYQLYNKVQMMFINHQTSNKSVFPSYMRKPIMLKGFFGENEGMYNLLKEKLKQKSFRSQEIQKEKNAQK